MRTGKAAPVQVSQRQRRCAAGRLARRDRQRALSGAARARSPSLRRLVPAIRFDMETWVVTHENLRTSKRIALVFDHLVESLHDYIGDGPRRKRPKK
jgi:hypothetical protein